MTDHTFVTCQNGIRVEKCALHGRLTEAEAAEKIRECLAAGRPSDWREAALQAEMAKRPAARVPSGHRAESETQKAWECSR